MAIELTSKGTKKEDEKTKPEIYAGLGIEYLFLYDVLGEYLKPPLQGLRLARSSLTRRIDVRGVSKAIGSAHPDEGRASASRRSPFSSGVPCLWVSGLWILQLLKREL